LEYFVAAQAPVSPGNRVMNLNSVLERIRDALKALELRKGSYIVIFGSMAEGRETPLSDVDILVKGMGLEEALRVAELVERITGRRADIVFFEHADIVLLYEALNYGVFVAGDYEAFIYDRWIVTLEWLDFAEAYERMHQSYRRKVLGLRRVKSKR